MLETKQNLAAADNAGLSLPGQSVIGLQIRAAGILVAFLILTLPMMVVQWGLLKFSPPHARAFPHVYHRLICRLLGIRLHIDGKVVHDSPVLIVANHVSWLDITVLSAVAPVSFIAKSEVGDWPLISSLAKLQRTIFINRANRADVGKVTDAMTRRFAAGDALVLFAEGTSTDGNRVLPFHSALLAPVFGPARSLEPIKKTPPKEACEPVVQTLTLVYTHLHGIPIGRDERKRVAWYGDMEMLGHAWSLLKAGPLDVHISVSEPIALNTYKDRKELARSAEQTVRAGVAQIVREGGKPYPSDERKS